MSGRFRDRVLLAWALVAAQGLALTVNAELVVENREHLERLSERMDAARESIVSMRAVLHSQTHVERDGQRTLKAETGPTHWVSRGAQYRYETQEKILAMPEVNAMIAVQAGDGEAVDAAAVVQQTPPGTAVTRRLLRAQSEGVVLEMDLDRPGEAQLGGVNELQGASNAERFRHDPRHAGLTVLGVTLRDILNGGSWRHRPEDSGVDARRIVRWDGQMELDGRQVERVHVAVAWEAKGHRAAREYDIYIDPQRDWTIPLMVGHYTLDGERYEFERLTTELAQDGEGRWLPRRAEHRLASGGAERRGSVSTVTTIASLAVNDGVTDEDVRVFLEPGTVVYDHGLRYRFRYLEGEDRQVVDEIARTLVSRTDAGEATGVQPARAGQIPLSVGGPKSDGWVGWAFGGIVLGGAVAGFGVLAMREGKEVRS